MPDEGISAVILAGGKGARMGGIDKGMLVLAGATLVERAIAKISPHVDEILISANRNLDDYARLGFRVLSDEGCGPLCGMLRGMQEAKHPLVLSLPCDTPLFPGDIAEKLAAALGGAEIAIAEAHGKTHQTFLLCRRTLARDLSEYIARGGRRVREWQSRHHCVTVSFPDDSAFYNINTPEEFEAISSGGMR